MSGLRSGLRPYQQETVIRADSPPLEDTMNKSHLPQTVAAFAAIITTLVLFSSVASLADSDKAALAAAKSVPGAIAANTVPSRQR
jgi:hypothetical protein